MKISVVMPVYNGGNYLEKAVRSVLNQHRAAHELIIVDDGSTDGTPEVLARFGRAIRTVRTPNQGIAGAMNLGLSMVTGDWVAFIDHDDVWFRTKLSRHAEAAARWPDAGFFCSNFAVRPNGLGRRMIDHFSALDIRRILKFSGPYLGCPIGPMMHENIVGTSTSAVVRMDVARRVGEFNRLYRISGDYDYWLRCALVTPFVVWPEMLFYKRTHAGNISADTWKTLSEHRHILREFAAKNAERLSAEGLRHAAARDVAAVDYQIGRILFESGRRRKALWYYTQAWHAKRDLTNTAKYVWTLFKKGVRVASFGRIRRKAAR